MKILFESEIPAVLWMQKIDRDGQLFVSNQTIAETDSTKLNKFLNRNEYTLLPCGVDGALIVPKHI